MSVDSEARLQSIIQAATDGIITIDERGIVDTFNAAAERLFGYLAKEVIGKNVSMLMPSPSKSGRPTPPTNYASPLSNTKGGAAFCSLDIKAHVLRMDLPGVKPQEIDIQASGNQLTISDERKEEKEENGEAFHRIERRSGRFSRSFMLPCEVQDERIDARYQEGVLKVTLLKTPEATARPIEVKTQVELWLAPWTVFSSAWMNHADEKSWRGVSTRHVVCSLLSTGALMGTFNN